MGVSVRDLHNDTIKQFENSGLATVVGYVTQKVLRGDTTLRLFILGVGLRQVTKRFTCMQ